MSGTGFQCVLRLGAEEFRKRRITDYPGTAQAKALKADAIDTF
jgi:hypothetical protein